MTDFVVIGGGIAGVAAADLFAVLYDRLIEQFNVQIVISAGNSGAGLNTVGDPSVAGKSPEELASVGTGDGGPRRNGGDRDRDRRGRRRERR